MYTIDGPVKNDDLTWWKVRVNGDYDDYRRYRAWVAQKDMAHSAFSYGTGYYFTASHCEGRGHDGVDIGHGGNRRYVYSGGSGTAYHYYDNDGYGHYVKIFHGNGYSTLYAHLSRVYINDGDEVGQFDLIGKSGTTGSSTGVHLHQELRRYNTPVEWHHHDRDKYGRRIRMWNGTGIPHKWGYIDC